MANLRESLAATAYAGLAWDENTEKAIDRVAASGKADPLGLLLWKARYMLESVAYAAAQQELLRIYRKRYRDNPTVSAAIVGQAMREYINPACRACQGRGEMRGGQRIIVCPACNGTKIHRYGDAERARLMAISYGLTKASSHKLQWLAGLLNGVDKRVNYCLNVELERFQIVKENT